MQSDNLSNQKSRYPSYQKIRAGLVEKIEAKNKKIAFFNELIEHKRICAPEEYKIFIQQLPSEKCSLLTQEEPISSPEEIALTLEEKAYSTKEKSGRNYQPILIDHVDNADQLANIIEECIKKGEKFCFNIIKRDFIDKKFPMHSYLYFKEISQRANHNGEDDKCLKQKHCIAMQVIFNGSESKIFALESAMTFKELSYNQLIAYPQALINRIKKSEINNNVSFYLNASNKQKDKFSCNFFALRDLNTLQRIENPENCLTFFDARSKDLVISSLESCHKVHEAALRKLHPAFLKSSQNKELIKEKLQHENSKLSVCSKKEKTLETYIQEHSIVFYDQNKDEMVSKIEQNHVIEYKALQDLTKALNCLDRIIKEEKTEAEKEKRVRETIDVRRGLFPGKTDEETFNLWMQRLSTFASEQPKEISRFDPYNPIHPSRDSASVKLVSGSFQH